MSRPSWIADRSRPRVLLIYSAAEMIFRRNSPRLRKAILEMKGFVRSNCSGFESIVKDHQLVGFDRQNSVGMPLAPREFDLESGAIIDHHNRTHLAATQQQVFTRKEMPSRSVFQQSHDVVHVDL